MFTDFPKGEESGVLGTNGSTVQLQYIQESSLMEACVQYVSPMCARLIVAHCEGY